MELAPVTKKIVAFGSKQVFLPKFTVALCRTPKLSPYLAKFQVPLNFSKYDLRDYLYHAYAVKVHSIRSMVKQMPVRDAIEAPRQYFREESKKYMVVEMEKPFVWPEEPEDYEPWGKQEKEDDIKMQERFQGVRLNESQRLEAEQLREHALTVLGKKTKGEKEVKEKKEKKEAKERKEEKIEGWSTPQERALYWKKVKEEYKSRAVQRAIRRAANKGKKPTTKEEILAERWSEQRTPQILNHERLSGENFAGIMRHSPKESDQPSRTVRD